MLVSHNRTAPSAPPLAMSRPSLDRATPQIPPVRPSSTDTRVRSATRHRHIWPVDVPAASNVASPPSATEPGRLRDPSQHRNSQLCVDEACVLRIDFSQVCLTNREAGHVQTPQALTLQQSQRVDDIARPMALLGPRSASCAGFGAVSPPPLVRARQRQMHSVQCAGARHTVVLSQQRLRV